MEELCNRVAIVRAGRVAYEGSLQQLRSAAGLRFRLHTTDDERARRVCEAQPGVELVATTGARGLMLQAGDFVICADKQPSIQARERTHPTLAPEPGSRAQRVEHTYRRQGALTYLAALDIGRQGGRRPRVVGRSEPRGGIEPFDRLVWQVMTREPYALARRVFWIVDNGSAHRGQRSVERLEGRWPNLTVVHLPVHASWLNRAEIYFSILQRKVLTPNDCSDLGALARTLS